MWKARTFGLSVLFGAVLMAPFSSASAQQAEWLCQAKDWESSNFQTNWTREKHRSEDIFRLRILGPSKIRITGSDLIKNGDRRFEKRGTRYVFVDRVTTTNQFGFQFIPRGTAYFDAANGEISMETTGAKIMGIQKYHLIFGNCE